MHVAITSTLPDSRIYNVLNRPLLKTPPRYILLSRQSIHPVTMCEKEVALSHITKNTHQIKCFPFYFTQLILHIIIVTGVSRELI